MKLPEIAAPSFVLFCLSANVGSIVEKATVMANEANGDLGNAWLKTHSAGAGPYQLTSWQASDRVIIDLNPHSGIATGSKRIIIRHVADPSAQLLDAPERRRRHRPRPHHRPAEGARPATRISISPPPARVRRCISR